MSNPWLVDDIEDFWFLNCPECAFKTKEQKDFQKHAVGNHTLSLALFSYDSSESLEAATNNEEIETEVRNFKEMKHFDVKEEPDDCLMTDDPTLEEIMYPNFEEDVPDLCGIISTKKSPINRKQAKKELKREAKIQLKNLIVKQCTRELISPARLAVMHKINEDTIRRWVKDSGEILPTKYNLQNHGKLHTYPPPNKSRKTSQSHNNQNPTENSLSSNDIDMLRQETQAKGYQDNLLCPKCDYIGYSQFHLDSHLIGHYDCEICGQTFFGGHGKRNLARHLKKHAIKVKKQFICEYCNVEYISKFSLERHQNTCKTKLLTPIVNISDEQPKLAEPSFILPKPDL